MSAIVRVVAGTDALHRIKRRSPIQRRRLLSQCRGGGCLPTLYWAPLTTLAAVGRARPREKSRFLARLAVILARAGNTRSGEWKKGRKMRGRRGVDVVRGRGVGRV